MWPVHRLSYSLASAPAGVYLLLKEFSRLIED